MMGRGKDADELVATMNQAAERAVPGQHRNLRHDKALDSLISVASVR
jgi:hypothetical protein